VWWLDCHTLFYHQSKSIKMNLEKTAHYNDLSPKLRQKLTDRINSFGKQVRYKFAISNPDPHPDNKGQVIWPNIYTLDPTVFNILDPFEDRKNGEGTGLSKSKKVAYIIGEDEKGLPNKFKKIRVEGKHKGVLTLRPEEGNDDFYMCMLLELHPKLSGGDFSDKEKQQVVTRVNETATANEERLARTTRKKAMDIAENMTIGEVTDFANAMSGGGNVEWDSTQDEGVLRNKIEALAEREPAMFNDLVEGKKVEYQALVKKAMIQNVITFDPAAHTFSWSGNKQLIATLSPVSDKNEVQLMGEFLETGNNGKEIYKKLKSLVEAKPAMA